MVLCAFLKSKLERKKMIKPDQYDPKPPHPAARFSTSKNESNQDTQSRKRITCWYCGKLSPAQRECRLRRYQDRDRNDNAHQHSCFGLYNRHIHQQHGKKNQRRGQLEYQLFVNTNDRLSPGGFLTHGQASSTMNITDKSQQTWLNCKTSDHFFWNQDVF